MPYVYQKPEVFMEYHGVKVYHVYKDSGTQYMKMLGYWYTLDPDERERYEFDVRDVASNAKLPRLGSESEEEWFKRVLRRVIGSGHPEKFDVEVPYGIEINAPEEFDQSFSYDVVKVLEGMGAECEHLDELVYDCKGAEAQAINNSGMLEQVDFLLRNGVTWEQIKDCIPQE
jgi:hypothetical protein